MTRLFCTIAGVFLLAVAACGSGDETAGRACPSDLRGCSDCCPTWQHPIVLETWTCTLSPPDGRIGCNYACEGCMTPDRYERWLILVDGDYCGSSQDMNVSGPCP